jgi:hypothetical protein
VVLLGLEFDAALLDKRSAVARHKNKNAVLGVKAGELTNTLRIAGMSKYHPSSATMDIEETNQQQKAVRCAKWKCFICGRALAEYRSYSKVVCVLTVSAKTVHK